MCYVPRYIELSFFNRFDLHYYKLNSEIDIKSINKSIETNQFYYNALNFLSILFVVIGYKTNIVIVIAVIKYLKFIDYNK